MTDIRSDVLCVDLDGAFLRTDTFHECLFRAIKARPFVLFRMPFWLMKGRYHMKAAVANEVVGDVDIENLPRTPEVETLIRDARREGRRVELVTAANESLIASKLCLEEVFDEFFASANGVNLKGEAKAEMLRQRHPQGFAYIGNDAADLPVWRAAAERYAVNLPPSVRRQAAAEDLGLVELARRKPIGAALLRSMRLHQWLKNLLVFVPLVLMAGHATLGDVGRYIAGFVLFGLLTSGSYLINDILDVEADRRHPRKRYRPIAAGELPLFAALAAGATLIVVAVASALFLNRSFGMVLVSYLVLTLAYSFRLKREPILDVLVIAILFSLRILAGMVLTQQAPSDWLLIFTVFFFFSLALMKRDVELNVQHRSGGEALHGRGYALDDRILVVSTGVASGMASLVIFALFIAEMVRDPASPYTTPVLLWGSLAAIGYWMMRMWLLTTRGLMNDDPILYAARDRTGLILGAITLAFAVCAQLIRL